MCYPVRCPDCGKTTWAACGRHADNVMNPLPPSQRCTCRTDPARQHLTPVEAPRATPRANGYTRLSPPVVG
nr:hypothetical protein [Mycobacterium shimoidei]